MNRWEDMASPESGSTLPYKRAHFVTHLPRNYRYNAEHAWIAREDSQTWRVGLTRFATRQLGDIVEVRFDIAAGTSIQPGQVLGWIEGLKATSDLSSIATGYFIGANPQLAQDPEWVRREPYGRGWLYRVQGQPDPRCMDVHAYAAFLDQLIDRWVTPPPEDIER